MSLTGSEKVANLLDWLNQNAFWNNDQLNVEQSNDTSGIGVFFNPNKEGIDQEQIEDDEDDNLLLRIPKENILSPKNSLIWNLLVDHQENHVTNFEVNLTQGMHSIVISFIYELSHGEKSPWFQYIQSMLPSSKEEEESINNIPICLWSDNEKSALFNTECDLLNMLDSSELVQYYVECIRFAKINESLIDIPSVLKADVLPDDKSDDFDTKLKDYIYQKYHDKLIQFGKYVQTVISRAFEVDDFHGLSLVPGADLFNHIPPSLNEDSRIIGKENVHFVCDGGEEVCATCGEIDCEEHLEEDDDLQILDESEDDQDLLFDDDGELIEDSAQSDDNDNDSNDESNDDDNGEDNDKDNFLSDTEILKGDSEVEESDLASSSDDDLDDSLLDDEEERNIDGSDNDDNAEGEKDSQDNDEETHSSTTDELPEIKEITMDYIKKLDEELQEENSDESNDEDMSDAETAFDDEEVSTLSISDDEDEDDKMNSVENILSSREELAVQLSDGSKCCDIVLAQKPDPSKGKFELFNTYGNGLSNPYLLQRYGFVTDNINDQCMLSVQLFQYLKNFKSKNSELKIKQLNNKLAWYEEVGFEFVNDLTCQYESRPALPESGSDSEDEHDNHDDHDHDHDHDQSNEDSDHQEDGCCGSGGGCCGDEDDEDELDEHTQILIENLPESWQLSPRINGDGSATPQTYALVKLLIMPYKLFHYKLIECASERKLARRIFQTLLPYDYEGTTTDKYRVKTHQLIKDWCKQRLNRYKQHDLQSNGVRSKIINHLVKSERSRLQAAIETL